MYPLKICKKLVHKNAIKHENSPPPLHSPRFYNAKDLPPPQKNLTKNPQGPPSHLEFLLLSIYGLPQISSTIFWNMLQQQMLIFCVRYNSDTVGRSKNVNFFDFFIWITFDSNFWSGIGVSLSNFNESNFLKLHIGMESFV